jgi:5-methylcytosine-specific restriction protein A
MPIAPPRWCARCRTGHQGRCPESLKAVRADTDRWRGSSRERGYTSDWDKCRAAYVASYPLCKHCEIEGVVTLGEEVDHIHPIRNGGALLDWKNLQNLCRVHHRRKTLADRKLWGS